VFTERRRSKKKSFRVNRNKAKAIAPETADRRGRRRGSVEPRVGEGGPVGAIAKVQGSKGVRATCKEMSEGEKMAGDGKIREDERFVT